MDAVDSDLRRSVELKATYTTKDLILYALAVGFGSDPDKHHELCFLYERHPSFEAVPTFCLALSFWADEEKGASDRIKPFPPVLMRKMGVIPKSLLKGELSSNLPVIHVHQSITWHRPLPTARTSSDGKMIELPVSTILRSHFCSVLPKKLGTFVTTETEVVSEAQTRLCTMKSTALVMGVSPDDVIPFQAMKSDRYQRNQIHVDVTDGQPDFEWTYTTTPSQALLYRIASGDSNSIHVDPSAATKLLGDGSRPILHGLCTMGIATRAIIQYVDIPEECFIHHLSGNFTKPVFVGDALRIRVWEGTPRQRGLSKVELLFTVSILLSDEIVLDRGRAVILLERKDPHHLESKAPRPFKPQSYLSSKL